MNTATPAATSLAPLGCSPAIATPAAPITAITTVCSSTLRSGKPSRTAIRSVTAKAHSASVTASALPCNPGTGWLLALPSTTTNSTAQPSGRSVPRCRCSRSWARARTSATRSLSGADDRCEPVTAGRTIERRPARCCGPEGLDPEGSMLMPRQRSPCRLTALPDGPEAGRSRSGCRPRAAPSSPAQRATPRRRSGGPC